MGRKLRFVPEPGLLVHVTNRCAEARYFLRPSEEINACVVGVLGRAQRHSGVEVVATAVLSNHLHLLAVVKDAQQLSQFMHFVDGNIAKKVNRILGRSGPFWQGRFRVALVANSEEDQVSALRYVLEQGCKENLVLNPLDWPGVHSAAAGISGKPLVGTWVDGTAMHNRRRSNGGQTEENELSSTEVLYLSSLPCWKHLSQDAYQAKIKDLVANIATETRERHRRAGTRPLGARSICRQRPGFRPQKVEKSPASLIRAANKELKRRLLEAYRAFVCAFRAAAELLKESGDLSRFPPGSFPPGAPFVPLLESG